MTVDHTAPPAAAGKLLASPALKVRLGVVSGVLLALGALLAPELSPTSLSTPQEHAAPLLEEQLLQREVPVPFRGVADVSARVRDFSVAIPDHQQFALPTISDFSESGAIVRAAGFGVFVSATHALTHAAALDGRLATELSTADGRRLAATVAAFEPATGLVLLSTEPSGRAVLAPAQEPAAQPGMLAAAVGNWESRDIVVPVFITSVGAERYTLSVADRSILPGMPIYDLEGQLIAIVGDRDDLVAFPVRAAAARLIARAAAGDRRTSLGVGFQELTPELARVFGDEGVVINTVVAGGPADVAGIEPGDVLLTVGDVVIDSRDTAARALGAMTAGAAVTLQILRTGRARTIEPTAALAFEVAALSRAATPGAVTGLEARALFEAALLEQSGIPAAARIVRVNGRAVVSRAQVQRELRTVRAAAVPVLLDHGGSRFFAAIETRR